MMDSTLGTNRGFPGIHPAGHLESAVYLGVRSGASGVATISGQGSILDSGYRDLAVGFSGSGTLNVLDGGQVFNRHGVLGRTRSSGESSATVSGAGSTWSMTDVLVVSRQNALGTVLVENGGRLVSRGGILAQFRDTNASVKITGNDSIWEVEGTLNTELVVGHHGTGSLVVENGGRVQAATVPLIVSLNNHGTLTVRDAGSELHAAGLVVGHGSGSNGVLNVLDGGRVQVEGAFWLGNMLPTQNLSRSHGEAIVAGASSTLTVADGMLVGNRGDGYIQIVDGGQVFSGDSMLGSHSNSDRWWTHPGHGEVQVTGNQSNWNITGGLWIGGDLDGSAGTGILSVSDGASVSATDTITVWATGDVLIGPGAALTATGDISNQGRMINNGSVHGDVTVSGPDGLLTGSGVFSSTLRIEDGGTFRPGESVGLITATDAIFDSSGRFLMEINDAEGIAGGSSGWDLLQLSESLVIDASAESPFQVSLVSLGVDGLNGELSNFDASRNYSWDFVEALTGIHGFDPNHFSLDIDGFANELHDGTFSIVQRGNRLQVNFTPVPEPSSLMLVYIATAAVLARRRRRSSRW